MNYLYWSLGFLLGNCILQQLPWLPNGYLTLGIGLLGLLLLSLLFNCKLWALVAFLCGLYLGFLWALGWGHYYLNQGLPDELIKQNVEVIGQIASIPQHFSHHVSFNFRVQQVKFGNEIYSAPKNIRLSWYENTYSQTPITIPELKVGQTWQFTVRLKPPYSFASPGALDYSQFLFAKHIDATGYVYTRFPTQLLSSDIAIRDWVNHVREHLWNDLLQVFQQQPQSGMVAAFVLGETVNITPEEWKILQSTGTTHLIAISGLNIGLVAVMVLALVHVVWRQIVGLTERLPAKIVGSCVGLIAGLIYTALAGFAIPTQRALITLALVVYGVILRRATANVHVFASAIVLVLLYDALASLSISFWLSYLAVAAILYIMSGRVIRTAHLSTKWYEWGYFQFAISFLLAPITLWFFQQAPLISPLANAVAAPWVSFVVVPLSLLGSFFLYIWPSLGIMILHLATYAMQGIWQVIVFLSELPFANWQYSLSTWAFVMVMAGIIVLLLPRGIPGRWYGICGLLPLWLSAHAQPAEGEVWLDVLDVGQGLATVVRTQNHTLIYDAGDAFSERLNAGSAIVLPFLRSQGVKKIDNMILSHDNKDHTGGAEMILQGIPVDSIYSGEKINIEGYTTLPCIAGQQWNWDGVLFTMLHPDRTDRWDDNNASCVLKIHVGAYSALLTGDIESAAEKSLLKLNAEHLGSSIIIAPHHGSRSSSTVKFLQQVNPRYVIFPAGYLNRFNFPNNKIVERYENLGIKQFSTGDLGTIHVVFDANSISLPRGYREQYQRYWH